MHRILLEDDYKPFIEHQRRLNLNMKELRMDAYENDRIYKERTKNWHDKCIIQRDFKNGYLVLLFNSRLKLL